jgi:hypothetical protein
MFELTPQREEALSYFKNKEVDHFSIVENVRGIEFQIHFWDKQAHFDAELLEKPNPKVYNIWKLDNPKIPGLDFSGKKHHLDIKDIKHCKYGDIHIFPSYFIDEGCFVPKQIITNLISEPDIIFVKDKTLLENIDKIWKNLIKRLIQESDGKIDLDKKSILLSMYGHWNMSEESKERLSKKIREELKKQSINP